jgi:hypothetical protein
MRCMSKDRDYGTYWINYSWILHETVVFIFWTALFALIIFPRFWLMIGHTIRDWITMKT